MRILMQPLTREQQLLVQSLPDLSAWVRRCLPAALVRAVGLEECVAEAMLLAVRAAALHDPDRGTSFKTYVMSGIRAYLRSYIRTRFGRNVPVWCEMPVDPHGEAFRANDLPDTRRFVSSGRNPLLAVWCAPENRTLRRVIGWRSRLVLYLRFVELWPRAEVAETLGVSAERVRQLEDRARARLAEERARVEL